MEHFGSTVHSNAGAHVTWTCAYESRLTVTTDEFLVDDEPIIDKLSGTGDLGVGFELSIHDDVRSKAPISEQELSNLVLFTS